MDIKDENELRLLICYNDYDVFNKYLKTLKNEKEQIMEEMKQLSISASHFDAHNIKYDNTLYNEALNKLLESLKPLEKNTEIFYMYFNEKQENLLLTG